MFRICSTLILLCLSITICLAQKASTPWTFKQTSHSRSEGVFLYTLTTTTEAYTDLVNPISINNGMGWDEPEYSFPIGFPFEALEEPIDGFEFNGSGSGMGAPTNTPYVYVNITPFEADLMDRGGYEDDDVSLSPISYVVEGDPGSRIFKLEFKNAGSYWEFQEHNTLDMFVNFQMWLYEGSNQIQFRFGPSSIDDPELFYDGNLGAFIGVLLYDEFEGELSDVHLLAGNTTNPYLSSDSDEPETITGTPSNGTVYTLTIGEPIELDLNAENSTSYCDPNGAIETEVSGGIPPYTYAWSNIGNTSGISGLDEGTYSVTVTDQVGNTASQSAIITSPDPMELSIDVTDETGDGADDGTAEVTATDGNAPYSYEWDNGATTAFVDNLPPGIYHVTVTDEGGCSETAEAIINAFGCPELILEASISHNQCAELCEGEITIVEVINGVAPFTYEWDNDNTGPLNAELCAGFSSVTVTDANLCFVIATYEITEPPALGANAIATDETLAGLNDGTATAASFGGTPPYTFLWSNGGTTQMITGLAPGTYSVIVTDNNFCIAFDTVIVAAGPCAELTATITDASCFGVCDGSIELLLGGIPPADVTWTGGNGGSFDGESCADEYIIAASDGMGCTVVDTFIVGQPGELFAFAGSTPETIAGDDGTAWATPIGGTPPYAYLWNTGSTDSLITGLIPGTYVFTLTDGHGCTDVDSVQVEPFVCFHIIPDEVQDVFCHDSCDGLIFVAIQGGVGPFEYEWSNGDTSNIIFDLCPGWYSVTVTDIGQGGCSDFIDLEVTEPDSFYATAEVVHLTDSTVGSIDLTMHGGTSPYFFVWFGPEKFLSFEEDISGLGPGVYIYHAFDSHDCEITDTIEILDLGAGIPTLPEGVVSIYPNPANDYINVKTEMAGDYEVTLFSALGTVVGTWQNATRIEVGHLVSGMYVVAFRNSEGRYIERVIIK